MHTSPSNKRYIGVTKQKPMSRWRTDGSGYKDSKYFWNAIQKYGWDNFQHEILFENLTQEEAEQKEIELISYYKSNQRKFGYNIANGGNCVGTVSEETRLKISYANTHRSEETREKLRQAMLGKKLSDETKRKMSESRMGYKFSEESRKKISESRKGKPMSDEAKEKMIKSKTGKKLSEEHKSKISKALKGHVTTEETRLKLSKSHKGKVASEETKKKLSEAAKRGMTEERKQRLLYWASHKDKEALAKMSESHKIPVIQLSKEDDFIKRFDSATDAGIQLNINSSNITSCCKKRYGYKTVGGYKWMYASEYDELQKTIIGNSENIIGEK